MGASVPVSTSCRAKWPVIRLAVVLSGLSCWGATASDLADLAQLERFADQRLQCLIENDCFPGAAIAVVKDDQVLFAKGYGVADMATATPVEPETTLFRLGSISKLVTSLAVLQLAQRLAVDLDTDVNRYLQRVQVPATFAQPVTLRHLLTHTDGFDTAWALAGATFEENQLIALQDYLAARLPPRIAPPGQQYIYGNAGMALAGLVVQDIAEQAIEDFVEQQIFAPLQMTRTSFRQPLPAGLAPDLAQGHRQVHGIRQRVPFEYVHSTPTAGLSGTVADMATLMIALLNGGLVQGNQALDADVVAQVVTPNFRPHPNHVGATLGMAQVRYHDLLVLRRAGTTLGHGAILLLVPAARVGLFIACNQWGYQLFDQFCTDFLQTYFPHPAQALPVAMELVTPALCAGRYRYKSYSHTNAGKLSVLAGLTKEVRVRRDRDGALALDYAGQAVHYLPVGIDQFAGPNELVTFRRNATGDIVGFDAGLYPFQRIAWWEDVRLHRAGLAASLMLMLGVELLLLFGWFRKAAPVAQPLVMIPAMLCIAIACQLVFAVGFGILGILTDPLVWFAAVPALAQPLLWLPLIALPMLAGSLIGAPLALRAKLPRRYKAALVLGFAAAVAFEAMLWYWKLLGFHLT